MSVASTSCTHMGFEYCYVVDHVAFFSKLPRGFEPEPSSPARPVRKIV